MTAADRVQTTHIQSLITEGLRLAKIVDGVVAIPGGGVEVPARIDPGLTRTVPVEHALERAANLLSHAAEELRDERLQVLGWPRV